MGVCVEEVAGVGRAVSTVEVVPVTNVIHSEPIIVPDKRWWPGLDGLRGVAVVLVVAFHLWPDVLPGGWVGVSMFFTLSGFLITTVLLDERARNGRISFVGFWGRRARRLAPALLVTVVTVVGLTALFDPNSLHSAAMDGAAGLAYIANWKAAAAPGGYGAIFGSPGAFDHLWSLAVEEQIYLILPILFVIASRSRLWSVAAWLGSIAIIAAGTYHWWGSPDSYYVTPVRAVEVAFGAAAAAIVWRFDERAGTTPRSGRLGAVLALAVGAVGVVSLAWVATTWTENDRLLFRGGPVFFAAASVAVVIMAIGHPGPLAHPVVRWLGTRSYAIYLWHWPLIALFNWHPVVIILVTGIVSELSMRIVETPIRRVRGYGVRITRPILTLGSLAAATAVLGVVIGTQVASPQVAIAMDQPILPAGFTPGTAPTVFVIGDSTAYAALDGLRAWSDRTGSMWVVNGAVRGCSPLQDPLTRVRHLRPRIDLTGVSPDSDTESCRFSIPDLATLAGGSIPDEVLVLDWGTIALAHVNPDHPFDRPADLHMADPQMIDLITEVYQQRIDEAAGYGATLILTTAPHLGAGSSGFFASIRDSSSVDIDAYNAVVTEMAAVNSNVELIHSGEAIDSSPLTYPRSDGVHLDRGKTNLRFARDQLAAVLVHQAQSSRQASAILSESGR